LEGKRAILIAFKGINNYANKLLEKNYQQLQLIQVLGNISIFGKMILSSLHQLCLTYHGMIAVLCDLYIATTFY